MPEIMKVYDLWSIRVQQTIKSAKLEKKFKRCENWWVDGFYSDMIKG